RTCGMLCPPGARGGQIFGAGTKNLLLCHAASRNQPQVPGAPSDAVALGACLQWFDSPIEKDCPMSKDKPGEPNPIINALSNAVAVLRADEDQLELAKAHEALQPK